MKKYLIKNGGDSFGELSMGSSQHKTPGVRTRAKISIEM